MNKENLNCLFNNYLAQFEMLNDSEHNEKYKWEAIEQVQKCWDLSSPDIAEMIKKAFSLSYNLVNNRIVQPVSGLIAVAKVEPETIRKALEMLLSDTDDNDRKQYQILTFVDNVNSLLEKHFPGKWKYEQDVRAAICYLAMIKPTQNYMFKSTPAHEFARYMEYPGDIGYGQTFKLRNYYTMCDELVSEINNCPALIEAETLRDTVWKDVSLHVMAYDLIYCFSVYRLVNGMKAPVPKGKPSEAQQAANRTHRTNELQSEIEAIQEQIDELQQKIDALPAIHFEGMSIRSKAFGTVLITRQTGNYLSFLAGGKERQFALPGCITNGFLIPEDSTIQERYREEDKLQKEINALDSQQRIKSRELKQILH